jgi:hypothetical protein
VPRVGALLPRLVLELFLPRTCPATTRFYSIIFNFRAAAIVLAFRPLGLFFQGGRLVNRVLRVREALAGLALGSSVGDSRGAWPADLYNTYWITSILTQVFLLGIAAASLDYASLRTGVWSSDSHRSPSTHCRLRPRQQLSPQGNSKGLNLGWNSVVGVLRSESLSRRRFAFIFGGAREHRSAGIYIP